MKPLPQPQDDVKKLRRSMRLLQFFCVVLTTALAGILIREGIRLAREHAIDLGWTQIARNAPQRELVQSILRDLRYDGVSIVMKPDFRIKINLKDQTWTVYGVHRYGPDGRVMLEDGRYGICGDLSAHVFDRLRPKLDPSYGIEFVRVAESQFFPASLSAHYVLRILQPQPEGPPQTYILDPSFHRYGPMSDFEDYLFYEPLNELEFVRHKSASEMMPIGSGMPIILHSKVLLGIVIGREGDQFDKDHYRLSLVATFRYRYAGRRLLSIRRTGDHTEVFENKETIRKALPLSEYEPLRRRLLEIFQSMEVLDGGGAE